MLLAKGSDPIPPGLPLGSGAPAPRTKWVSKRRLLRILTFGTLIFALSAYTTYHGVRFIIRKNEEQQQARWLRTIVPDHVPLDSCATLRPSQLFEIPFDAQGHVSFITSPYTVFGGAVVKQTSGIKTGRLTVDNDMLLSQRLVMLCREVQRGQSTSLGIYAGGGGYDFRFPDQKRDAVEIQMTIELPASAESPLTGLSLHFATSSLALSFGNLSNVYLDRLEIPTHNERIDAEYVKTKTMYLLTHDAAINGNFTVTSNLSLDVTKSNPRGHDRVFCDAGRCHMEESWERQPGQFYIGNPDSSLQRSAYRGKSQVPRGRLSSLTRNSMSGHLTVQAQVEPESDLHFTFEKPAKGSNVPMAIDVETSWGSAQLDVPDLSHEGRFPVESAFTRKPGHYEPGEPPDGRMRGQRYARAQVQWRYKIGGLDNSGTAEWEDKIGGPVGEVRVRSTMSKSGLSL